jgi:hypothetical protein
MSRRERYQTNGVTPRGEVENDEKSHLVVREREGLGKRDF